MSGSFTTESLALGTLAFLRDLPDTTLWHLARIVQRKALAADEILFRAGEPRTALGVVVAGRLVIEQTHEGRAVEIFSLGPGDVVSESVLLEGGTHGSSGRATEPTSLLVFPVDALTKLLKNQPAVHAGLLARAGAVMNNRIRAANATLLGARSDATKVRNEVGRWLDAVAALAATAGAERAFAVARDALAAGRGPSDLEEAAAARK